MQLLHRSRRWLVLLLTLGLVALSTPAQAALPSSTPTQKLRCANGKTAKAWIAFESEYGPMTRLAADNPCKGQWIEFLWIGESESDPYGRSFFVAPGQQFHWEGSALTEWMLDGSWGGWDANEFARTVLVSPNEACVSNYYGEENGWTGYEGLVLLSDKDVRNAPECGSPIPKYSASHFTPAVCPAGDYRAGRESAVTWKTEGKKVVASYIGNDCIDTWIAAWWKLDNGRTAALWIGPGTTADLWKTDFAKLPVNTKDGRVRVTTYYSDQAATKAFTTADPNKRPFYYNGLIDYPAGGDTVRCTAGKKSC